MSSNRLFLHAGLFIFLMSMAGFSTAQTNGFGFKLGPSLGFQKWGGGNQTDPLLRWHIAAFMDSESSDGKNVIYRSRKQTFNDFVGQLFV